MEANNNLNKAMREKLALYILVLSVVAIFGVAITAMIVGRNDPETSKTIFNTLLPVVATWVGTILAFYFGRENFESASNQMQKVIQKLSPEQRSNSSVSSIMKTIANVITYSFAEGKGDEEVTLEELKMKFTDRINRLPILNPDGSAKYMIHDSSIDKYYGEGGNKTDSLKEFIENQKSLENKREFGLGHAFIVVSEKTTLAEANTEMEQLSFCRDIFVTRTGNASEAVIGWISNVRMATFLEV